MVEHQGGNMTGLFRLPKGMLCSRPREQGVLQQCVFVAGRRDPGDVSMEIAVLL